MPCSRFAVLNGCSQTVNRWLDVRDQRRRQERPGDEHAESDHHPRAPSGGDVEHRHEQAHEHGAGADVALEDQQQHAERPDHQDRREVLAPRHPEEEPLVGEQRELLAVLHQVAGERRRQQQLAELLRLHGEPADGDLDLGAGARDAADGRRQQRRKRDQHQAGQAEYVRVGLQDLDVPDQPEEHHEDGDAEHRVDDLRDRGRRGRESTPDVLLRARVAGPARLG